MAHEIDTTTGNAAVFVTGEAAWHKLGTVVAQAQTSEEAIKLAHLDWTVALRNVAAAGPDGTWLPVAGKFATVRTDTEAALGIVGSNYRPFQNAQAFDFMDALVADKLAMFETAGSLKDGRRVWMMARIPRELRAAGQDVVNPYVLLTNSHDGTSALRMIPTSVRVVCQNTLNMALGRAGSQGVTIRHCESLKARVEEARTNLGIFTARCDSFQEEIQVLTSVKLTDSQAKGYFRTVFKMPEPAAKKAALPLDGASVLNSILSGKEQQSDVVAELLTGHRELTARQEQNNARILEQLLDNYHNKTNTLPGIEGSAWAAFNAVSEYTDHQSRVFGRTAAQQADNRLNSIWFGNGDNIKQQAYSAALSLAI